jgi:hypothetical protein
MGGKYPQRTLNTAMADAEQLVPSDATLRRPNLFLLAVFDLPGIGGGRRLNAELRVYLL